MTNIIHPNIEEILSFVDKSRRESEMLRSISILRDVMTYSKKILLICFLCGILSLPVFSQSKESALALFQKGESLVKSPEKAYPLFVEAMKISKRNNDLIGYLNAVNRLGPIVLFARRGDPAMVFEWTKEAIEIFKNTEKDSAIATLHYNVAGLYFENNGDDLSIFHYEVALKIRISLYGELSSEVASCYHGMGDVYKYSKFDFINAERCYEKALATREKINFQNKPILYQNYYSLAATNRSQRDFEKALSYGSMAIKKAGEFDPSLLEEAYGMVANIYRDMGESASAKKFYQTALVLNKKTNNPRKRVWYYLSLGETFMNDSSYNEALKNFYKAQEIYRASGVEYKPLLISLLIDMIKAYSLNQNESAFFKTVDEVFKILATLDKSHSKEAYTVCLLLGDHYEKRKSYDSALMYYQKALIAVVPSFHSLKPEDNPSDSMIGFVYYIYEGLAKKAAVLKRKFDDTKSPLFLEQSLDCLILAEKLVSQHRNTLDMENAKWEFLDSNYDLYENILSNLYEGVDALPNQTMLDLSFRYFEQSKSRSLADALTQTQQISTQDSLFQVHSDLKRKVSNIQDRINRESENIKGSKEIPKLREELASLDLKTQICKQAIEVKYPGYFNVKYGYKIPYLRDVQQAIRQRDQVIIEYFWGTEYVYGIAIGQGDVVFKRIGKPDSIKAFVNKVLLHLSNESSSLDREMYHLFIANSHRLYNTLIDPFKTVIQNGNRIQIIPDGPISQVPFEVLLMEKGDNKEVNYKSLKYMIKSHTIGYAYSISRVAVDAGKVVRRPSLLAVGFTAGQRVRAGDPRLEEIQGAELELDALAKRFKSGRFLEGKEATEANFKLLSPNFDIIHLAIHGKGDVQKNFSASLYFRSKFDSLDDGELHSYELYGLRLKASLAVLSACESGLGKGYKGEGMISMASAFTYSGCENILMSLWKVNDQASTILMDDFYGHLLDGKTIDDALRQAKLKYLETADEFTADPKIWAPLVAYGSLHKVFQKDRNRLIYTSLGALILLAIVFFAIKRYKSY